MTVAITGLGMASSFGYDVIRACAAHRAGISRVRELSHFKVRRRADGGSEPVMGHPVPLVSSDFVGIARLVSIAWPALRNLLAGSAGFRPAAAKTTLHLAIPDPDRTGRRIADPDTAIANDRRSATDHTLARKLTRLAELDIPGKNWREVRAGRAGVASAIAAAARELADGKIDHCIVGGVDSLLEVDTLQWLDDEGRLKTSERPVGFVPGEAAAFVLLERRETARRRGAEILAIVAGAATGVEKDHLFTGKLARGLGLSETIAHLLAEAETRGSPDEPEWVIVDQNGEPHGAEEWGHTLVRLATRFPGLGRGSIEYPAASFGDTGAASGGVALCAATRAFARGYERASSVLITSSSETGERGAMLLTGPTSA